MGQVPSSATDPHPSSPITGALNNITALHVQQGILSIVGAAPDFTGAVTIDGPGTLDVQAQAVNNTATMTNNGTLNFNQPFVDTYSGAAITGAGRVVKFGFGDLTMNPKADNTYTGGTMIQQGALVVDRDTDLGAATGSLILGTDAYGGSLNGTIRFDSNFDLSASRAITILDGGGTFDTQGYSTTVSQAVTGTGALTKQGSGTLTLTGANTYQGGTYLEGGTLGINSNAALGAATSSLYMYDQTALRLDADVTSARQVTLYGPPGSQMTIDTQANTGTFNGVIDGNGTLTKTGGGTLVLTGANSYRGATVVQQGTLAINSDNALGNASNRLVLENAATLRLDADVNSARLVTLGGAPGSQMTINTQGNTGTFSGVIDGYGALNKTGSGTLVLPGANNYVGGTIIRQGTLAITSNDSLGQSGTTLAMYNQTALRLDGNAVMASRPVVIGDTSEDSTTPNSVTINTNGHNGEIGTAITEAANAGSVRLDKTGAGVLALYGANAYNGGTWVRQDTVAVKSAAGMGGGSLYLGDAANMGTLRADADFSVSGKQFILNTGGGAVNTNGFNVTLAEGTLVDPTGATAPQTGAPGDFHKTGAGVLTVLGDQTYTRNTYVDGGTFRLDAVDPANPMANTKGLINTSSMNIAAGARLEGQGLVGTAGALTTNSGTIAPGLAGFTDTFDATKPDFISLTLNGDYTATPGAMVEISTQLVDDSSQHGTLVIKGVVDNNSAVTGVRVIHDGGSGATTDQGIEIIRVLGTADHAAEGRKFALISDFNTNGRPSVVAGAYAYWMEDDVDYLNSANPNLTSGIYLRNAKRPDGSMVINPSTPLYETYSIILGNLNRLPTLEQRVGHRNWLNSAPTPVPNDAYPKAEGERAIENRAVWVRLEGGTGTAKPDLGSSGGRDHAKYDLDYGRLNLGIDMPLYISDGGSKLIGGVNLNFGQSKADVTATQGGGTLKTKNEGVGATLTWYADNGFYADAQGRYNWFDTDIRSNVIHSAGDQVSGNDGDGYAFSLELGRIFNLSDRWSLTPQVQLTYSVASFDDFTDAQNTLIINENDDKSLEGRLGLAVNYENSYIADSGEVSRNRLYGLVNYYREFKGDAMISVSTVGYKSEVSENWVGLAVGGSRNWGNDQFSVYGELGAHSNNNRLLSLSC